MKTQTLAFIILVAGSISASMFCSIGTAQTDSANLLKVADFSGHWVADTGVVKGNVNSTCSKITIDIEQNATGVTTKKYSATCTSMASDWGPVTEEINGGKVSEHGDEVGTIDETTMQTRAPDGSVVYIYDLQLIPSNTAGEPPMLRSIYGTQSAFGSVTIEAALKRIAP